MRLSTTTTELESIAYMALVMGLVDYRPPDSCDRATHAIEWGLDFTERYEVRVANGTWEEDEYLERVFTHAYDQLAQATHLCLNWEKQDGPRRTRPLESGAHEGERAQPEVENHNPPTVG